MSILAFYIAREIFKSTFLAVCILVALVTFFTFTDELDDIGRGDYDLRHVFEYLALITPQNFYQLMPSAAMLGSLVALGGMTHHHELVAMRTLGVSIRALLWAALSAGLVLSALGVAVGEWVAPDGLQAAKVLKATAQHSEVALRSRYGLWLRDGPTFIHIGRFTSVNELRNIVIYRLDEQQRLVTIQRADSALYETGKWQLRGVEQSELIATDITTTAVATRDWESILDPSLLAIVVVKPNELSSLELFRYVQYLHNNKQKSETFEAALWTRLLNPAATLVMMLLSLPLVIRPPRGFPLQRRIFFGAILGLVFYLLNRIAAQVGVVYHLNPALSAAAPILIFFAFGVWRLKRSETT